MTTGPTDATKFGCVFLPGCGGVAMFDLLRNAFAAVTGCIAVQMPYKVEHDGILGRLAKRQDQIQRHDIVIGCGLDNDFGLFLRSRHVGGRRRVVDHLRVTSSMGGVNGVHQPAPRTEAAVAMTWTIALMTPGACSKRGTKKNIVPQPISKGVRRTIIRLKSVSRVH